MAFDKTVLTSGKGAKQKRVWIYRVFGTVLHKGSKDMISWKAWALSWDFLLSFWRCRWIGISPVMASIPNNEAVINAPTIYEAAHLWNFPNDFKEYKRGALE